METHEITDAFKRRAGEAGLEVKCLSPAVGFPIMLSLFEDQRVDGCDVVTYGDMLLYCSGRRLWDDDPESGESEVFVLELQRQFKRAQDPSKQYSRLSLCCDYELTPMLEEVGNQAQWCASLAELPDLKRFLDADPAFQMLATQAPNRTSLLYFEF